MSNLTSLRVYHQARPACAAAYRLANGIASDAALRDQMRRAAVSVALNIAEGRGRSTDADFARFLVIARGSNTELVAQLALATDLGLVPAGPGPGGDGGSGWRSSPTRLRGWLSWRGLAFYDKPT